MLCAHRLHVHHKSLFAHFVKAYEHACNFLRPEMKFETQS